MQIVIDKSDFRRLSANVQQELVAALAGAEARAAAPPETAGLRWRQPVDLTPEQATRLVHGLSEDYRRRLELFTIKSGRVHMRDIMAVGGDHDLRPSSDFQKAMTRRLRRLVEDPQKKAQLIGWDFETTKWDDARTTIVDGVYYVTEQTAAALRSALRPHVKRRRAKA